MQTERQLLLAIAGPQLPLVTAVAIRSKSHVGHVQSACITKLTIGHIQALAAGKLQTFPANA